MRCEAVARTTKRRCARGAMPGSRFCRYHQGATSAVEPLGVQDEIALLKSHIRKAVEAGDEVAMRKGIETLCKAVRIQYVLGGRSAESLAGSLSKVLEEVGNELGITL